jgi:hypothetical protein
MNKSFIEKVTSVDLLKKVCNDIALLHQEDNKNYPHAFNLQHDTELIIQSLSHESLLIWNIHVWAHFNGEMYDGMFIGITRKIEKFNKKIMEEYLWLSKNSNSGIKLYMEAVDFAKKQKCDFIIMHVSENHPVCNKLKDFYLKIGFQKDTETYIKKL